MAGLEIVTLDSNPPKLDGDSALEYARKITDDPIRTLSRAQSELKDKAYLHDFILRMEDALEYGTMNIWTPRILLMGAAISAAAYQDMGFYPDIDEDVEKKVAAEALNAPRPGVFLAAAFGDFTLDIVIDAVVPHMHCEELAAGRDLLVQGAGITRMFYRTALAA